VGRRWLDANAANFVGNNFLQTIVTKGIAVRELCKADRFPERAPAVEARLALASSLLVFPLILETFPLALPTWWAGHNEAKLTSLLLSIPILASLLRTRVFQGPQSLVRLYAPHAPTSEHDESKADTPFSSSADDIPDRLRREEQGRAGPSLLLFALPAQRPAC
jgi:hypothetical protein